jgi:PleD family two-component response regulator
MAITGKPPSLGLLVLRTIAARERTPLPDQMSPRPPLVLIASDQEWSSRALDSTLGPQGYAILRAYTGKQALELVGRGRPDIVLLTEILPDASGLEICRTLREKNMVTASTGILVMAQGPVSRELRLEALRAGASECLGLPIDGEELGLRLMSYFRAKFDADQAREQGLVDQVTGLYNVGGLTRRARELGSQAYRRGSALSCVILSLEPEAAGDLTEALARLAQALRRDGRVSDAIGRVGTNDIAIFAPETPAEGAEKLTERLKSAVERATSEAGGVAPRFRSGYFAVPNFREGPVEPQEMLLRASAALRQSKALN